MVVHALRRAPMVQECTRQFTRVSIVDMVSGAALGGAWESPEGTSGDDDEEEQMLKGFKNFLMQGDLIIIAVGLVVALAFSTLIKAFTDTIITPLINAAGGGGAGAQGLGWTINGQRIDLGAFIAAVVYFIIFMAVIYFVLVVPYRAYMKKRGTTVFGDPAPTKSCPSCLSDGLPLAATKCKFCASEVPAAV
jgi:large conductance mechanosensitive channel